METNSRRLVVFPTSQFYAVVGTVQMPENPYQLTIPEIFNERSHMTHAARDHEHRPGKIYFTDTEFYGLHDNSKRLCHHMDIIHIAVNDILVATDFYPERFVGRDHQREDYKTRKLPKDRIRFLLNANTLSGSAESLVIYRSHDRFLGVSEVAFEDDDETATLSLTRFFEHIGCPVPDYMAIHLGTIFHD
jgi:hypothetical protein